MALPVPFHPYGADSCLNCGSGFGNDDGKSNNSRRCFGCKTAFYCDQKCQREDWRRAHRRECQLLRNESDLAKALSATDQAFSDITDGRSLRQRLVSDLGPAGPLKFVVKQLSHSLEDSVTIWDSQEAVGGEMALGRMDILSEAAESMSVKRKTPVDWLQLSAILFGTNMIHSAIHRQRENNNSDNNSNNSNKNNSRVAFESFLWNFGEFADRVKLFAILQEHDEFPLLKMSEPTRINGQLYLPESQITVGEEVGMTGANRPAIRCFICGKQIPKGVKAISPHQIDRRTDLPNVPRLVNYLPPRSPLTLHQEGIQQRLRAWLHIVARCKMIPKEFVCSESCEQHSIYGRMFEAHPLPKSTMEEEEEE